MLKPEKKLRLGSGKNRRRLSTAVPLLEQWRNDPDLNFLFQDENSVRSTSLGPQAELRNRFPDHNKESVSERLHVSASSFISAFFPPEGFCYKPYYQFPHPSNSFNRSERSSTSFYSQTDVEVRGFGPSLNFTSSYF